MSEPNYCSYCGEPCDPGAHVGPNGFTCTNPEVAAARIDGARLALDAAARVCVAHLDQPGTLFDGASDDQRKHYDGGWVDGLCGAENAIRALDPAEVAKR